MHLNISGTGVTPSIQIKEGEIQIKGRSIPEDDFGFYEPVIQSVRDYLSKYRKGITLVIMLDYVNSGSRKYLVNMLHLLEEYHDEGIPVAIKWHYDVDDESIHDLGLDVRSLIRIPVELVETRF